MKKQGVCCKCISRVPCCIRGEKNWMPLRENSTERWLQKTLPPPMILFSLIIFDILEAEFFFQSRNIWELVKRNKTLWEVQSTYQAEGTCEILQWQRGIDSLLLRWLKQLGVSRCQRMKYVCAVLRQIRIFDLCAVSVVCALVGKWNLCPMYPDRTFKEQ